MWMWELDCEESWVLKNGCFWTVVLEKTLESPLDWKGIKPVNPRGNQSWIFIRRTDAPILRSPVVKSWPSEKTLILGKIEGRRRGRERMGWLDGITDSQDMGLGGFRELVMNRKAWRTAVLMGLQRVRHDWTELIHSRVTFYWNYWLHSQDVFSPYFRPVSVILFAFMCSNVL